MLERLAPAEGQRILDLAAGTGVVGFAAAPLVGPSGRVIVSDFAEAMVEAAACSVFAGPEQNPWAALPSRVLQERGHMPAPEVAAPGILALADRDRLRALFEDAGFPAPRIEEIEFVFPFADVHDYWDFLTGVAGGIAIVLERLDEDERARVRQQLVARVAPFDAPGRIELPALALVVSAS
jgi:hypothetical protein